jgi:CRP/FNR family transcriptional regulator, nitrogen oxide reductase regulator
MASRPSAASVRPRAAEPAFYPKSRLLEGLTSSELQSILSAAAERRFPANSVIINQGDPADHLFLLTKGCVRHFFTTQRGQKVLLLWLVPGEAFGGRTLLPEYSSHSVSTEAMEDSIALVWPRDTIRALARQYPRLLENAVSVGSDYLAWFLAAHIALISHTARERVAQVLLSLAQCIGHKVAGGIELDITNEQLANAANVTMFTASRLMSEWRRSGALSKTRGKVILRSPERLLPRSA